MRVLITGAYGLVGGEAMRFFAEKGWDVTGVDNNQRERMFGLEMPDPYVIESDVYEYDIRDKYAIENLFMLKPQIDAIIHAAAQPSHDYAKDHVMEDFDINARATVLLLEATRKYCPEATFVHVSTDKVYGENMRIENNSPEFLKSIGFGFDESIGLDFAGKRSLFGCSKTAADIYVQEYGNYFGMKTACFRPGCITGKNHKGAELHGFLAYLAKCVKEGRPYTIFGGGDIVRDQIHVYDLVNAFWHFIENPKVGAVYNIGGGSDRAISIGEAIARFESKLDKSITVHHGDYRKGDRVWDVHDVSKFKKDYPEWDYKYSLEDIIDELCA